VRIYAYVPNAYEDNARLWGLEDLFMLVRVMCSGVLGHFGLLR
jgi:hypothetical protein